MPLNIKAAETGDLARRLAALTGESVTQAVTIALRERLARESARRTDRADAARLAALAERLRSNYETHPVTRAEWDAASGETG